MKKFLPLLLLNFLFLFAGNANSQTFLDKTPEWKVIRSNVFFPDNHSRTAYFLKEETTLNGKQYHTLYSRNEFGKTLIGLLREDAGKVYINGFDGFSPSDDDILLYDFNLQEGDVYTPNFPENEDWFYPMTVTKVSTIVLANGEEAREIQFENGTMEWIEGVGNTRGVVAHFNRLMTDGSHYSLACLKKDDLPFYTNDYSCKLVSEDCCIMVASLSEALVSDTDINIENGDNCFIITFENMSDQQKTIQLVDLSGKVLKEIRTTDESYNLDMLSYPNGVYLIQAQCGQAKSVSKVMKSDAF